MHVKICGIKRAEDALKAFEFGADSIGVLVGKRHFSKDFIDREQAKKIIEELPCDFSTLVIHLTNPAEIIELVNYLGVTNVQLHDSISVENILAIKKEFPKLEIIKAVHVVGKKSIEDVLRYSDIVDFLHLDTINKATDQIGGTGLTHDWNMSRRIVAKCKVPVFLAGGLTSGNVKEAILKVKPFGVDVNSGVKGTDGFEDYEKMKLFIENAKDAFNNI